MNDNRRQKAHAIRISATDMAASRPHPKHISNGDETKFRKEIKEECSGSKKNVPSYLASFTKGMPHDENTGLVDSHEDFYSFVKAIDSGDPRDFKDTRLGPVGTDKDSCIGKWRSDKAKKAKARVRAWESESAGLSYELEGPDAQAVTMPPAPALGSKELTAEIAEVYAQALLRDVSFTDIVDMKGTSPCNEKITVGEVITQLNDLEWFTDKDCCDLNNHEKGRKRTAPFNGQTVFRGITPGDDIGPYISQFLLLGNTGLNGTDKERDAKDGLIAYGALNIDQRVRIAKPCDDHMTNWHEWLDVQEGADLRGMESYTTQKCGRSEVTRRFITTPRDLATYVHYDALYEAYLNACLVLLGMGTPFDPDIPFQACDCHDHQQGFAQFGGPHILTLVTEVATRALKAVRYQKYNIHRRMRPEVLAARLSNRKNIPDKVSQDELNKMANAAGLSGILQLIEAVNGNDANAPAGSKNLLLPMAFCEGSPMHPSYGAGHATVAGACITLLKAFFDHNHPLQIENSDQKAYVPVDDGCDLKAIDIKGCLTIEGELNKLASNISIGRDWAGVHYFSDYIESLRMGEQIAIGLLEEQKLTYGENFSMTVPLYDGGAIRI